MNQSLVPIKKTCTACQGHGYLETGQTFELLGRIHPELTVCSACEKRGFLIEWVDIQQLAMLLDAIVAEKGGE
jgi:DnaJ-class molecular chaperone